MKKSSLMAVWGIFYIICAGLGFIPEPEGAVRIFLTVISVLFFVPPAILLYDAFSGIETTSLDDGEHFPDIRQQTAPKNRYSTTTTMTQYPGSEMRVGSSDPVAQEVVR